jgi:hypothetical protein
VSDEVACDDGVGPGRYVPRRDAEDLAFCTRLKPALRMSLGGADLEAAEARFRARGAFCARSRGAVRYDGQMLVVLYAAWTRAEADDLREIEAPLLRAQLGPAPSASPARRSRELGLRLGYPRC